MNTEIDDSIVLDAMRYRWLRHGDNDEKVLKTYTSRPSKPGEPTMFLPRNDELDRLIDAARAALAPHGQPPAQAAPAAAPTTQPAPQQEVPAQPTEPREWAKISAGYAHVDSMLQQADGERGGPFWHGWALREAFVAGAEWQEGRKRPAAPQPSPASQGDALDAARYRYLRDGDWREHDKLESIIRLQLNSLWDAAIDAAIAAQGSY